METGMKTGQHGPPGGKEPYGVTQRPLYFSGVKVYFPRKPFSTQIALMNKLVLALENEENAILESPTGTGKVFLALLRLKARWPASFCLMRSDLLTL